MNRAIYISGPVTGCPDLNFAAFDRVRDILKARGDVPHSPADLDRALGFASCTREFAVRDTEVILRSCHGIYMMDGWYFSKGSAAEFFLARWIARDEENFTFER